MTLLKKTMALKMRVGQLSNQQARFNEMLSLQNRLGELSKKEAGLSEVSAKAMLLQRAGLCLPDNSSALIRARKRLDQVEKRFADTRTAAALTKGIIWNRLLEDLNAVITVVNNDLHALWQSDLDNLFTGETPSQLDTRLAKTERNEEVLTRYRQAYDEFRRLRLRLPDSVAEVPGARETVARLGDIFQEFDFKVPDTVKAFLLAVAQGGAPFELLTVEVREWLVSSDLTEHYRVVVAR